MRLIEQISDISSGLLPRIIQIRRHLHAHPELSFEEYETSAFIKNKLDEWGVEYTSGYAGTGVVAVLDGSGPGKVIGLRGDMDALPILEETNLPFKSVIPGKMHACGHDVHTSVLLGAINILKELKPYWKGRIKFVFQPGEEKIPGGARLMLDENALGPDEPALMIALHVYPELKAGKVGFCSGKYMASSDEIYLTVKGKGGHGALPDDLIDPVLIAAHLITSLQQVVSRKAKPAVPTVLSFGRLMAHGAVNVIPDEVNMEGTFRTMDEEWRKRAHEIIRDICESTAKGMGGKADLEIRQGYPVLINDPKITGLAVLAAGELLGKENVLQLEPRMTAEDFAYFAEKYPAVLFRLGTGNNEGEHASLHTSRFNIDEHSLLVGMQVMVWLCMYFLDDRIDE